MAPARGRGRRPACTCSAPGRVDELAGDLLGAVARERIVALGGGRVGRHRQGAGGGLGRDAGGDGRADDAVGRRDDAHPPARARRRPARADGAPARGRQRPGAVGLAAARRSWRRARSTRSATPSRGRARRSPTRWRRSPPTRARGCSRARCAERARPRRARARRAAGRLRDRLDRLRAAPRALADARAARRRRPRAGQRRAALPHDRARWRWRFPERIDALGVALDGDPADVAARMCRLVGRDAAARHRRQPRRAGRVRGGGRRSGPSSTSRRRAPTARSCWHSTRGHGERRTEGGEGEDARRGRARRRDRHLRALLRAARGGRVGDARRRRPRPALRRPGLRRPARRGRPRGARQGRDRQAQRRARDEHGHGAGEVAARGQGGPDLPRHHRRPGARAARARTARGCRSCS